MTWFDLLRLIFGTTMGASAAILATYLVGFGTGALMLGRRGNRRVTPLRKLGRLTLGIAVAAAISPFLVDAARWCYVALGGPTGLGLGLDTVVRFVLSGLVTGLPLFLMGGTLPWLARASASGEERGRCQGSTCFAAVAFGAALGALATPFVVHPWLGMRASILAMATLNAGIALLALTFASSPTDRPPSTEERHGTRVALPAAAGIGFASLLVLLVGHRMLAPLLGRSVDTTGLILGVGLFGIAIGGVVNAIVYRGVYGVVGRHRQPTLRALGSSTALAAVLLAMPFALGDRLAVLAMMLQPLADSGFLALVSTWALITAIIVLPMAIVVGYQVSLLVGLRGAGRQAVGSDIGAIIAWAMAGALGGLVVGGFGIVPLFSTPHTWCILVVVVALFAIVLHFVGRRTHRSRVSIALVVLALALTASTGPTGFWRHSPIGTGTMPTVFDGHNDLRRLVSERRRAIVWAAESATSSFALEGSSELVYRIDGVARGSALRGGSSSVMSALIGAALHPEPTRALVLGLGTGQTASWLAAVPSIERIDVLEPESTMLAVADRFRSVNDDVLEHPKVNLVVGDGRAWLASADTQYDLIVSPAAILHRADRARFVSQTHYRLAAARLAPGGLLLQGLSGDAIDTRGVGSLYATLESVLPVVETWQIAENDLLWVAGREALKLDRASLEDRTRLETRLAGSPFARALDQFWGLEGLAGLLSGYVGGPDLAEDARDRIITDDRPRRTRTGRGRHFGIGASDIGALVRKTQDRAGHRPFGLDDDALWSGVVAQRQARQLAWGGQLAPLDADSTPRAQARHAFQEGDLRAAYLAWSRQSALPESPIDGVLVAEASAELGDPRAEEHLDALSAHRSLDRMAILARWQLRSGDRIRSVATLDALFTRLADDPWIYPPTLARALDLTVEIAREDRARGQQLFDRLENRFAVHLLDALRRRTRLRLAQTLDDTNRCVRALEDFEPHVPWEGRFLLDRYRCYAAADHPRTDAAQRDVESFLAASPPRLERDLLSATRVGAPREGTP